MLMIVRQFSHSPSTMWHCCCRHTRMWWSYSWTQRIVMTIATTAPCYAMKSSKTAIKMAYSQLIATLVWLQHGKHNFTLDFIASFLPTWRKPITVGQKVKKCLHVYRIMMMVVLVVVVAKFGECMYGRYSAVEWIIQCDTWFGIRHIAIH